MVLKSPAPDSKITALYLGWTDSSTQQWFPLQKLTWSDGKYYMVYLQGMLDAMEINLAMKTLVDRGLAKIDRVKITKELPEDFRKRMPVNRPFDSIERLNRLGLPNDLKRFDPFEYVARNGLCNLNYELCAQVKPDTDDIYHFYFGEDRLDPNDIPSSRFQDVNVGDDLDIRSDGFIYHHNLALAKPFCQKIGRAPRYIVDLVRTSHREASADRPHKGIAITVERINNWELSFGRILCHVRVNGKIATPFSDRRYQPLVDALVTA